MNIFPTPIHLTKINEDTTYLQNLILDLQCKDEGRIVSNRGGWQSQPISHHLITNLLINIMSQVVTYIAPFKIKSDMSLQFTQVWANINTKHDYNINHLHSGFISGVYYIKTPPNSGKLIFHNPDKVQSILWHTENFDTITDETSLTFEITPEPDLLVLFPAHLEHSVSQNNNDESRLSISFNMSLTYAGD